MKIKEIVPVTVIVLALGLSGCVTVQSPEQSPSAVPPTTEEPVTPPTPAKPVAPVQTKAEEFFEFLEYQGYSVAKKDQQGLVDLAIEICDSFDANGIDKTVRALSSSGADEDKWISVTAGAVLVYCPEYEDSFSNTSLEA